MALEKGKWQGDWANARPASSLKADSDFAHFCPPFAQAKRAIDDLPKCNLLGYQPRHIPIPPIQCNWTPFDGQSGGAVQ